MFALRASFNFDPISNNLLNVIIHFSNYFVYGRLSDCNQVVVVVNSSYMLHLTSFTSTLCCGSPGRLLLYQATQHTCQNYKNYQKVTRA